MAPRKKKKLADGSVNWNHYYHKRKEEDPVKARFFTKRSNARKAGHGFTLTLEEFRELFKGISDGDLKRYDVDRIDSRKDYQPGNVQVLPIQAHKRKTRYEREAEQRGEPAAFTLDDVLKIDNANKGVDVDDEKFEFPF